MGKSLRDKLVDKAAYDRPIVSEEDLEATERT
jgi:hypothetical protein